MKKGPDQLSLPFNILGVAGSNNSTHVMNGKAPKRRIFRGRFYYCVFNENDTFELWVVIYPYIMEWLITGEYAMNLVDLLGRWW